MASWHSPHFPADVPAPGTGLTGWAPNASALLAVIACAIVLAATELISSVSEASASLYLAGGISILATPAIVAATRRALRPTGAEVLPAVAYYLSIYHAPVMRVLLGGRPIDGTESFKVLQIALYGSVGVSCLVSLRPGAFDRRRALPPALEDTTPHAARIAAYAGMSATLIGYLLLAIWIGTIGLGRISSASLTDVYLYGSGQSTVTFQWPFIAGGIITMALAFARWPGPGPSLALRGLFWFFIAAYVWINARLGARGPSLGTVRCNLSGSLRDAAAVHAKSRRLAHTSSRRVLRLRPRDESPSGFRHRRHLHRRGVHSGGELRSTPTALQNSTRVFDNSVNDCAVYWNSDPLSTAAIPGSNVVAADGPLAKSSKVQQADWPQRVVDPVRTARMSLPRAWRPRLRELRRGILELRRGGRRCPDTRGHDVPARPPAALRSGGLSGSRPLQRLHSPMATIAHRSGRSSSPYSLCATL